MRSPETNILYIILTNLCVCYGFSSFFNQPFSFSCDENKADNIFISFYIIFFHKVFCFMAGIVGKPANIYLFKVNNRNTRKRCEIYSKLIIMSPNVFSFEHIQYLLLLFLLLTLSIYLLGNTTLGDQRCFIANGLKLDSGAAKCLIKKQSFMHEPNASRK